MPREAVSLVVDDLSTFTKSLRTQLLTHPTPPGHQALLNMVARAAGHRNLQTLMATPRRHAALQPAPAAVPQEPVSELVRRTLHHFDTTGRLTRLPAKRSLQAMALWGLWMRFDAKRPYRESEVNGILNAWHAFGDHCTLRRDLVTQGFLARTADSATYSKRPARPDADGMALMRALRQLGS